MHFVFSQLLWAKLEGAENVFFEQDRKCILKNTRQSEGFLQGSGREAS